MKAKILVVEDEKSLSDAYKIILKSSGYIVKIAEDGAEGLELADSFKPDLILLDLRMPRVSGIDFLKKYQVTDKHPHVKVIVFSNMDTQKEIDEAYALGATHYILKAWASPKELTKLVADTLSNT
jgi:DNA-binding response OmpR family regulator